MTTPQKFQDVDGLALVDRVDDESSSFFDDPSPALPGEKIAEGWATSYEVIDKVGDQGTFGQFAASLGRFRKLGKRIPVTLDHDWKVSTGLIGYILPDEAVEVRTGGPGGHGGLYVRMHLLVDESEAAAKTWRWMAEVPLQMSYAFDAVSEKRDPKSGANRLHAVDLLEVCVTLFGAVSETSVRQAKRQNDALRRTPEFKAWAEQQRTDRQADMLLPTFMDDRLRPNKGRKRGTYDPVADWEAFVLSDPEARFIAASDMLTEVELKMLAEDDTVIEGSPRCACGQYMTPDTSPTQRPVEGGTVQWKLCDKCGAILAYQPKSMTDARLKSELANIRSKVEIVVDFDDGTTGPWDGRPITPPRTRPMPDHLKRDLDRVKRGLKRLRDVRMKPDLLPPDANRGRRDREPDTTAREIDDLEATVELLRIEDFLTGAKSRGTPDDDTDVLSEWTRAASR